MNRVVVSTMRWWIPALVFAFVAAWVVKKATPGFAGDEWRYVWYAENLLEGYYSPRDNVMVWNGPVYPALLVPMVALGWPALVMKLANAVFLALAAACIFDIVAAHRSRWLAGATALFATVTPLGVMHTQLLYTEPFTVFALSAVLWMWFRAVGADTQRRATAWRMGAGVVFAVLVLSKVVFGAVLGLALVFVVLGRFVRPVAGAARALTPLVATAAVLCAPWILYTHSLSGQWMHWSSGGGQTLYWMASPFPEEKGEWFHHRAVRDDPMLAAHHGATYERIRGDLNSLSDTEVEKSMPGIGRLCTPEADREFRSLAVTNIRARPGLYLRNVVLNLGRLFFGSPYTFPRPISWEIALPGGLVLVGFLGALGRRLRGARWPSGLATVAVFVVLTTGILSLISGMERFLIPLLPALVLVAALGLWPEASKVPENAP